jgi:hypothetical protein
VNRPSWIGFERFTINSTSITIAITRLEIAPESAGMHHFETGHEHDDASDYWERVDLQPPPQLNKEPPQSTTTTTTDLLRCSLMNRLSDMELVLLVCW